MPSSPQTSAVLDLTLDWSANSYRPWARWLEAQMRYSLEYSVAVSANLYSTASSTIPANNTPFIQHPHAGIMWYIANVGPVPFRYAGAVYAAIPPLDDLQVIPVSGEEMHVLNEKGRSFLVVDHRASPGSMARIEFWPTAAQAEGGLDGLFVLSDAQDANTRVAEALALAAIADLFPRADHACAEREPLAFACR